VCRGRKDQPAITVTTSWDNGVSGKVLLLLLSTDGDADVAVEIREQKGWNKFNQLAPLLTNTDVSLLISKRLYIHSLWAKL